MPLFYLSVAYLLGVALAPNSPWPALVWLLAAAAAILLTLPAYRLGLRTGDVSRRFPRGLKPHALRLLGWARLSLRAFSPALLLALPFLAAASLALGAARAKAGLPDLGAPGHISAYNDDGRTYTLTGLLIAPPDARDSYTNLRLAVESIRPRDGIMHQAVSGILLVRVKPDDTWRYGDRLVVTGKIETPPEAEGFSYRDYLARRGVYSLISFGEAAVMERGGGNPLLAGIYALRGRAHETLHRLYPDPAASLLAGILLGLDNGLPAELQQAFRDTGTAHIIAISGFNITILSAVVLSALGRLFGRRAGGWLAGLAIGAYTILVGADPAVVRAAIMGLGAILLRDARRPGAALNMLALTAALMALANPGVLGDAGFQLSFAATLGLVRFSDPLARGFGRAASRYLRISTVQRITPVVTDAVLLSLAAQIATLPVSLVHFGRISLSSLLVNPLILPVQPAVMILGGISLVAGLAWPPLGELMALPVYPFVAYTLRLVEIFGALPGGVWAPGPAGTPAAIGLFALIFGLPLAFRLADRLRMAALAWKAALLLALLLAASQAWGRVLAAPDGRLQITFLEAGPGDGILIRGPKGGYVLVDGGPSASQLSAQLGRRLPPGERTLDWLVVARAGDEQLGALPLSLQRYPPAAVLWSGQPNASRSARRLQEALIAQGIPIHAAESGHALDLGAGARLEVVWVGNGGMVLELIWKNFRALLPVGQSQESLALAYEPVSLLLLAGQGHAALNPPDWVRGLAPQVIALSAQAGNPEGLPSQALLEALDGYPLLRTDYNEWIHLVTDGKGIWVEVGREQAEEVGNELRGSSP